jgi:hypothetical protein
MANVKKYVAIALKLKSNPQDVSKEDLTFFSSFTPEIDETRMREINDELDRLRSKGESLPPELTSEALMLSAQQQLASPELKNKVLQVAQDTEAGKNFDKISEGLNTLLAGTDLAQSLNQIAQSKQLASKSRRPSAPAIPQRDQYLQQALRSAQEGNYNVSQAIAPAQAEIGDAYRTQLQNAKTASTGQAGAYGSYAQSAYNARNRAALGLVPLGNEVRQQNVQNYNQLLGLRQNETQNMFENSMASYPYDLQQYQLEQQQANHLGATGRSNLRTAGADLGSSISKTVGDLMAKRRYDAIRNKMSMYGDKVGDIAEKGNKTLDQYSKYQPDYLGPTNFEQAYIR